MISKNKKIALTILSALFLLNVFVWLAVFELNRPKLLEVIFFDVGQGDAILIKTVEDHYILIDGGPSSVILEKLAEEIPVWQRTIDLIILTHAHDDHFGGLIDVIKGGYNVENILWNGVAEDSAAFKKWEDSVLESEAEIRIAWAGQRIRAKNFSIDVLYPFVNLGGIEFKDPNLSSFVLRLVFRDSTFLFMGDAYKSMEKELIEKEIFCQEQADDICQAMILEANVLKVGHHGGKTSTAEEFVIAVSPEIAVISAGRDNRFGHPHQETLETLGKYGIKVFRTDMQGDVRIFSDGENIKIKY